jgi:hypothetical protein
MYRIIGIVLATLLLLVTVNSTYFFLGMRKVSIVQWIVFNACAPSGITYLIGFVLYLVIKDRIILHASILPMFFFGGLGLIVFPWSGYNIIAQISHLIMVLNIGWVISTTIKTRDFQPAAIGMLLGIIVFSFFIGFQQHYMATHLAELKTILGIEWN